MPIRVIIFGYFREKFHLFGHLLRNKILEIIAKIARKIDEKLKNLMGF